MSDKKREIKKLNRSVLLFLVISIALMFLIAPIGFLLLLITVITYFAVKKHIKDCHCSKCGAKRSWDDADSIEWEVVGEINDGKKLEDTAEIHLTCPACGHEDIKTKKIVVARVDDKGNIIRKNLEVEIRKMFNYQKKS